MEEEDSQGHEVRYFYSIPDMFGVILRRILRVGRRMGAPLQVATQERKKGEEEGEEAGKGKGEEGSESGTSRSAQEGCGRSPGCYYRSEEHLRQDHQQTV